MQILVKVNHVPVSLLSIGICRQPFYPPLRGVGARFMVMTRAIRLAAAAATLFVLGGFVGAAAAQDVIKQVKLSDKLVEGFIAAQKDMSAMGGRMQGAPSEKPNPKIQNEIREVAKKKGIKKFSE